VTTSNPVMIACYKIDSKSFEAFHSLLKDTETIYRKYSVLADQPILRLQSPKDPDYTIEIITWKDQESLDIVMQNKEIQAKWSEIKAAWQKGDFPLTEIPEAAMPWSLLRSLPE
jgi:hypothetical protein